MPRERFLFDFSARMKVFICADMHLQSYCCSLVRGILEEGLSGIVWIFLMASFSRIRAIPSSGSLTSGGSIFPNQFHIDLVLPVKLNTASAQQYLD